MNYSEIQIEELRKMIMDNSIDPSMITVDDCAEILYYEVERKEPCDKIINFCNSIIKSSNEYQSIKVKELNDDYKDLYNNIKKYHKKPFKIFFSVAATIIVLPFIFFTTVYAIKYIFEVITEWEKEKFSLYERNPGITSRDSIEPNDIIQDVYYIDDMSLLSNQIKNILPSGIYDKYDFLYCSILKEDNVSEYNFGFSEKDNILISFYEFNNDTNYYEFELPKEEESKYAYTSPQNQKYYICENENELIAVSINNNIVVSVYGDISIDDMKELIDMLEIPETLP
jgi:hypothetical protein